MPVNDIILQLGISEQTFYRWKKQYASLQSDQIMEPRQLQGEDNRLKKLVAELSFDKAILQDIAPLFCDYVLQRKVAQYIIGHYGLNLRRGCALVKQPRSIRHYRSIKDPKQALSRGMHELTNMRLRYGSTDRQ